MMQKLDRRRFVTLLAAGAAAGAGGLAAMGLPARARIVVLGGGPAGAGAALALRQARPRADVVLVERDPARLGRAAKVPFGQPAAGPDLAALRAAGVGVMLDEVTGLDWSAGRMALFSGRSLAFDRVLLAPGTAAMDEAIPGFDAAARHRWPAAWGSAREARRLGATLSALPERAHVVLRLPAEISHPQAALGRALQIATLLEHTRPAARLTVLDGGAGDLAASFTQARAGQGLRLQSAWHCAAEGGRVLRVDAARGEIETTAGALQADAVNFVTRQGAGQIARRAGLTDASGWCPTDARGLSMHRAEAVILGDARKGAARTVPGALGSARMAADLLRA